MTTAYTSLLGLALPVTGELSGTWGDTVNDYITQYLDASVAGTQTISGSQTAVTLSKTTNAALTQAGTGATGSSQYSVINCTGNPASMLTVTVPAASKTYVVVNATSTNQDVKIVGAGPTTGVTLVAGEKAIIAWNGSDFIKVASSVVDGVSTISFGSTGLTPSTATSGAVTVAGTLAAGSGGTGQSTYTSGDLLYATGATALSKLGIGTNGQILTSTGTAPQWSTLSGVAVTTFSAGTTGLTPNTPTSGAITLGGTLATTNGGTGLTSFTANQVFYASSTSAIGSSANLTFDGTTLTANALTLTNNPTLNGGTANGVAYLNGSKVLTTGSALTFNGTDFATTGSITLENARYYQGKTSTGTTVRLLGINSGNVAYVGPIDSGPTVAIFNAAASVLNTQFYAAGSEAMRLTSTGLGIGTSSPAQKLDVLGSIAVRAGTSGANQDVIALRALNSDNTAYANAIYYANSHRWAYAGATEGMRLDSSGNLGIGTSSPLSALNVAGTTALNWAAFGNSSALTTIGTQGTSGASLLVNTASVNSNYASGLAIDGTYSSLVSTVNIKALGVKDTGYGSQLTFSTTLGTTLTERMRLDYSGNLGLGVTPSAWSGQVALQVGLDGSLSSRANTADLMMNAYFDGTNYRYVRNFFASRYQQQDGSHRWSIAASGTAGNAISFTQAMTLGADGNLLLGTTSSTSGIRLDIQGASGANSYVRSTSIGNSTRSGFRAYGKTSGGADVQGDFIAYGDSPEIGVNVVTNHPLTFATNNTERARITAAGDVGIGTSSPLLTAAGRGNITLNGSTDAVLVLGNAGSSAGYLYAASTRLELDAGGTRWIQFNTNGVDRMRLDSSGNLSVGGTAARATTVGTAALQLFNGTAPAGTLTNGVSLYSQSGDLRFMDAAGNAYQVGFRNVPRSGTAKTTSYTLATTDVGEYIEVGSGGSITIPDATFATGDVVSIFNNTTGNITITCTITTAYIAGTDSDKATMTLATRGVATILFISGTVCVVTGNVT